MHRNVEQIRSLGLVLHSRRAPSTHTASPPSHPRHSRPRSHRHRSSPSALVRRLLRLEGRVPRVVLELLGCAGRVPVSGRVPASRLSGVGGGGGRTLGEGPGGGVDAVYHY